MGVQRQDQQVSVARTSSLTLVSFFYVFNVYFLISLVWNARRCVVKEVYAVLWIILGVVNSCRLCRTGYVLTANSFFLTD